MGTRRFRIAHDAPYCPCPKCGNKEEFYAHSQQCSEDCCEIWISCRPCGYDPFHDYSVAGCTGYCVEDVWGSIEPATIAMALDSWDELIQKKQKGAARMSEPKFTKGPWRLKSYTEIDHITDRDGKLLVGIHRYGGTEEDSALIAAAPEMYGFLSCLCASRSNGICDCDDGECDECRINQILKKARGEE